MDRGELQEAVARLIVDGTYDATVDVVAGAAVRVVLAEAAQSIRALPAETHDRQGAAVLGGSHWVGRAEALAVLAALGEFEPPPLV